MIVLAFFERLRISVSLSRSTRAPVSPLAPRWASATRSPSRSLLPLIAPPIGSRYDQVARPRPVLPRGFGHRLVAVRTCESNPFVVEQNLSLIHISEPTRRTPI